MRYRKYGTNQAPMARKVWQPIAIPMRGWGIAQTVGAPGAIQEGAREFWDWPHVAFLLPRQNASAGQARPTQRDR
jgi:hypothetical protein